MAQHPVVTPELRHGRDRFCAELGSRIDALRESVHRINQAENPTAEVYALKRRLHALGHAAQVLGFTTAADALARAETRLSEGTGVGAATNARLQAVSATPALIAELDHLLDGLPTLVLGGDVTPLAPGESARLGPAPLCLLLLGDASLLDDVREANDAWSSLLDVHTATDADALVRAAERLSPDVILLTGEPLALVQIVPRLLAVAPARLVASAPFEHHAELAALIELGVMRVLPRPSSAAVLRRVLRQTSLREPPAPRAGGDAFRSITPAALAELIAGEARRVLAPRAGAPEPSLDLGDGSELLAELWSTLARARALCEAHAPGTLAPAEGPEGALLVAPGGEPDPARDAAAREILSERRILIASDDGELAHFLAEELEAAGCVVLRAADGASALALARRTWPEAVVGDIRLPQLDGFALCRQLKRDLALGDVPVLLLGWRTELVELARRARAERAAALPGKLPQAGTFAPHGLLRDIARALEPRTRLEQRLARSGVVHGRLDGVNVRSLLQLACRRGQDGALRVDNAGLVFELGLEAGQLVRAELRDGADEARGEAVLAPLLAAHGARYRFAPGSAEGPHDFDGELLGVLEPVLRRTRAVERVLSHEPLARIERLVLDPHAVTQCSSQASAAVRGLVTQLMDGVPPHALTLKSYATREPLERVIATTLDELCLGGAVLAVLDAGGEDHVARALEPSGEARARSASPRAEAPRLVPSETLSIPPAPTEPAPPVAITRFDSQPAPVPENISPPALRNVRRRSPAPGDFELSDAVLAALSSSVSVGLGAGTPRPDAPSVGDDDDADAWRTPPGPPANPFSAADAATGAAAPSPSPPPVAAPAAAAPSPAAAPSSAPAPSPWASAAQPDAAAATDGVAGADGVGAAVAAGDADAHANAAAAAEADSAADAPRTLGSRVRGAMIPLAIAAAAGVAAFFGLQRLGIGARDERVQSTLIQAQLPIAARLPVAAAAPDAGAGPVSEAVAVELASEELAVPADVTLKAGHGLLEIHTWRRQRLYVDGVFVGNYASRRVPLNAGNYEVRLLDGSREIKRAVQVTAGQRTLLSVSKQTNP
jgi:CheY-like chemotaxis protein